MTIFQLTEIEAIDETYRQNSDESKNEEDIPVFAGFLVKRKLPYHYDGELAILSTEQRLLGGSKKLFYNPFIIADSSLEPVEVEDMAFNNYHDVYAFKNPNAKLSALKFLNPTRLNNAFGDTSYLANNRGYNFYCNIYIKDNMLYAAFNTGTSNLFNAWDTPNPEDVAKTYMFILREINEYLNKVIAGR